MTASWAFLVFCYHPTSEAPQETLAALREFLNAKT